MAQREEPVEERIPRNEYEAGMAMMHAPVEQLRSSATD